MDDIVRKIAGLMAKANGTENEHEAAIFAAKAQEMLAKHNLSEMDVLLLQSYGDINARGRWIRRKKFLLIGKPHNAAVAASMFTYLEKTTLRLAREWMRAHDGERAEQLDFERGCGLRLAQRLRYMTQEQRAAKAKQTYTGTTLPALYDSESKAIEEFLSGREIGKSKGRGSTINGRGGVAGLQAGSKVSLQTQVNDGSAPKQLS